MGDNTKNSMCWAHAHEKLHAEVAARGVSCGYVYNIIHTASKGGEPIWLCVVEGMGFYRYDSAWPLPAVEHIIINFIDEVVAPLPAGAC